MKEMIYFAYKVGYLFHTLKICLTCCKILRHGASGFTSPPMEGAERSGIALKNTFTYTEFEPSNLG
jgi:hypothetical protein